MLVCDSCGHQNADDAGFCANCGSYLEWTGRRQSAPQRSASIVRVTPTEVAVEPGKEAVCDVVMKNTGNVVDELVGKVVGDAAAWAVIEPASVRLLPGYEEVARIVLRPPRSPMVRAGPTTFTLQVSSSVSGGEEVARQDCVVTVGQFSALTASIVPQTAEALESAEHTLIMHNEGNSRADVELRASDPDDRLAFEFEPQQHVIQPGSSAASRLRVSRRQGVSRPDQRFPFQVMVQPAAGSAVVLDGALVQERPPAPPAASRRRMPWALPLGAALLLLAGGAAYAATRPPGPPLATRPSPPAATAGTPTPSPTPTSTPTPSPSPSEKQATPTPTSTPKVSPPVFGVDTVSVMPTSAVPCRPVIINPPIRGVFFQCTFTVTVMVVNATGHETVSGVLSFVDTASGTSQDTANFSIPIQSPGTATGWTSVSKGFINCPAGTASAVTQPPSAKPSNKASANC